MPALEMEGNNELCPFVTEVLHIDVGICLSANYSPPPPPQKLSY